MNRLTSLLLVCALSGAVFAQDDISRAKAMIRDGRCAEAIAPLQKIADSKNFRKRHGTHLPAIVELD